MAIVAGFDVDRAQITFDAFNDETGEVERGRIRATPEAVGEWVGRFAGEEVHVAVEACTGWLFVCEALRDSGATAHLAEPTAASALRGPKAPRQDRPRGCPLAADPARRGAAARGLDPAGARVRVAHPHPPARDARRRAHELAAASPKRRSFTTASAGCRTSC
jgi:hypothetical protein